MVQEQLGHPPGRIGRAGSHQLADAGGPFGVAPILDDVQGTTRCHRGLTPRCAGVDDRVDRAVEGAESDDFRRVAAIQSIPERTEPRGTLPPARPPAGPIDSTRAGRDGPGAADGASMLGPHVISTPLAPMCPAGAATGAGGPASGRGARLARGPTGRVEFLRSSPDGAHLATASPQDGSVTIWHPSWP
jgi:hypothetical protein